MRLLLDTHAFLWWDRAPQRLSVRAREAIGGAESEVYVSVASVWEMQIKIGVGKLEMPRPLKHVILDQQQQNGFRILEVTLGHLWRLAELPRLHRDPFDRMLVAQARDEGMPLVSNDPEIVQYGVRTLW